MVAMDAIIFKFQEQTLVHNSVECLWEIQYQKFGLVSVVDWACQVFYAVNKLCLKWMVTPEAMLMINSHL